MSNKISLCNLTTLTRHSIIVYVNNHEKPALRVSHGSRAVTRCEQTPTWLIAYA